MRSCVIDLGSTPWSEGTLHLEARRVSPEEPDLVFAFLPCHETTQSRLECLASAWPGAIRVGCETLAQVARGREVDRGVLLLLWFEHTGTRVWTEIVRRSAVENGDWAMADRLGPRVVKADALLCLADALRFPVETLVEKLHDRFDVSVLPPTMGGLGSNELLPEARIARVFRGLELLEGACLLIGLQGIEARLEVARGWEPASPIYEVTRAEDRMLHEIDGESAADWFARFFTVEGELVPLPESAWKFPLIIEGNSPRRRGLYRSLRRMDEASGSVELWGRVESGDRIRIGITNGQSLASQVRRGGTDLPVEAGLVLACVGRQAALGERARSELVDLEQELGQIPFAGFYSFGEVAPTDEGPLAFYNQTAVLALLTEVGEDP